MKTFTVFGAVSAASEFSYRTTGNNESCADADPKLCGMLGDSNWANAWPVCDGQTQSPIEIRAGAAKSATAPHKIQVFSDSDTCGAKADAQCSWEHSVNGHGVKWTPSNCRMCAKRDGQIYHLLQCHMHGPSEHAIDGKRSALEIHCVHRLDGSEGLNDLLVVGMMLNGADTTDVPNIDASLAASYKSLDDAENRALHDAKQAAAAVLDDAKQVAAAVLDGAGQTAAAVLEEATKQATEAAKEATKEEATKEETTTSGDGRFLKEDASGFSTVISDNFGTKSHGYFHYDGSLTTPPCTAGQQWYVADKIFNVQHKCVAKFRELMKTKKVTDQKQMETTAKSSLKYLDTVVPALAQDDQLSARNLQSLGTRQVYHEGPRKGNVASMVAAGLAYLLL